jgi:Tn7-like transposition protein D/TniQ
MATYFPKPLPDETATSIVARFRRHTGLNHGDTSFEAFGKPTKGVFVTMPPRMDILHGRMPRRYGYDIRKLVHEHTAVRYYTAFMSEHQRADVIAAHLIGDATGSRATGISSKPVKPNAHLRFCVDCHTAQLDAHGERYWRVTHQIPIATMCPEHEKPLRESRIRTVGLYDVFVCPDLENCPLDAPEAVPPGQGVDHALLLHLSRRAATLLEGAYPVGVEADYPDNRLLDELSDRGYVYAGNRVRWTELKEAARLLLSGVTPVFPDILEQGQIGKWFLRLREGALPHATDRVLLAAHVIANLERRTTRFGPPPWPCLNPLSDHYGRHVVTRSERLRNVLGVEQARFSCRCGYEYTRSSHPDGTLGNPAVFEFGPALDVHIERSISQGLSLRQTHIKAGVGANTMLRHAARRGIKHPWREIGAGRDGDTAL